MCVYISFGYACIFYIKQVPSAGNTLDVKTILIVILITMPIYGIFLWVTVKAVNLTGRYICDRIFHYNKYNKIFNVLR